MLKRFSIYRLLLGLLVFIATSSALYLALCDRIKIGDFFAAWDNLISGNSFYLLVVALILVPLNWGLEVYKWKIASATIYKQSFGKCIKGVLSGVTIGFFLPNRMGEFIGKSLTLPRSESLKAVVISMATSLSQLLVTLVIGIIAFVFIGIEVKKDLFGEYTFIVSLVLALLAISLLLLYFNLHRANRMAVWFGRFKKISEAIKTLEFLESRLLLKLLSLSLLRYIVFSCQYVLLLFAAGIRNNVFDLLSIIALLYFIMSFIPTITLSELPARGGILLLVYNSIIIGGQTKPIIGYEMSLMLASSMIWCMNLLLPALIGSFFIPSFWIFNKRNRNTQPS